MADHVTPATLFKCLADENRVRMMLLITREGELCVCEITCALNESQPKISRNLAQLREWASGRSSARSMGLLQSAPNLPDWIHGVLQTTLNANKHWLTPDTKRLEAMGNRPERTAACC